MEPVIKLDNVFKSYQLGKIEVEVLKDVSLEISPGGFIVILGPSGSGKSTLLNLISCLDTPTKGEVYLKGRNIAHLTEDELAEARGETIGFIFQTFNLLPHLTALENVTLPSIFQGMTIDKRVSSATDLLNQVGLKERLDHRPGEMSGGEKQRVAIARSLINEPEIIVADEPTGNVDSKTGDTIMKILENLNKQGRTVIVVTHDLDLQKYASRVIKIKDGEVEQ